MLDRQQAEAFVDTALGALSDEADPYPILSRIPVPVYMTDAEGSVTYWNQACVDFAGRVPQLGEDRWCVTWRLFTTDGDRMPHDRCPMADAIREKRPNRGAVAIALRPDGTRRAFTPYATPLLDDNGELTAAINILIDVSEEQAEALANQARRCRTLSHSTTDRPVAGMLNKMADTYEATVTALRNKHVSRSPD